MVVSLPDIRIDIRISHMYGKENAHRIFACAAGMARMQPLTSGDLGERRRFRYCHRVH